MKLKIGDEISFMIGGIENEAIVCGVDLEDENTYLVFGFFSDDDMSYTLNEINILNKFNIDKTIVGDVYDYAIISIYDVLTINGCEFLISDITDF